MSDFWCRSCEQVVTDDDITRVRVQQVPGLSPGAYHHPRGGGYHVIEIYVGQTKRGA